VTAFCGHTRKLKFFSETQPFLHFVPVRAFEPWIWNAAPTHERTTRTRDIILPPLGYLQRTPWLPSYYPDVLLVESTSRTLILGGCSVTTRRLLYSDPRRLFGYNASSPVLWSSAVVSVNNASSLVSHPDVLLVESTSRLCILILGGCSVTMRRLSVLRRLLSRGQFLQCLRFNNASFCPALRLLDYLLYSNLFILDYSYWITRTGLFTGLSLIVGGISCPFVSLFRFGF